MRTKTPIAVILLLVLAACGGGAGTDGDGSGKAGADTGSPTPLSSTATSANPLATGAAAASPAPGGASSRPCDPQLRHSANAGLPGSTYIRAVTRGQTRWGAGCTVLNPGDRCEVQWDGAYNLAVGTEAYLSFQGWAKGRPKPFKELATGPLPPENSFRRLGFPVIIPNAPEVAFRVVLLDQTKRPVAISDTWTYKVNCPSGRK